jgi:hypothetical protein
MPALYQQTYAQMLADNPELFTEFRSVHDFYRTDQSKWQAEFDRVGKQVLKIVEDTEKRLCTKMENSNRGKFSTALSDKFRATVRQAFPLIDLVGVTIS